MANSKQVIKPPRFLLQPLAWNSSSSTIINPQLVTIGSSPGLSLHLYAAKPQPQSVPSRSLHTLPAPPRQPPSLSLTSRPYLTSITKTPPSSTNSHNDTHAAPIRHNGVYVAVFKPARRAFHTTPANRRDHHFDTLKIVQRLKGEGFSEEQAVALMRVLNDVIEESIQNLTRTMVLREDSERSTYTQKVDFAKLRSELLNSDSTETQLTRASHDRIAGDIQKLNSRLRDEIGRTQASVRLDLNLEKGRIREEANGQEMRIKETETRIEQEVAGLRERVEAVKFSTLQWLMGVCTGTAALILGAWRLLM
ncbi:DUF1640 domain-containing protein [Blastomyces gilchristii SLH14081]|uniref:DUF1640 domain-containing protein n=1 Tax=Blastomyces gilchristii (strain SLH14081) TaxID=559298 RepID=A0A179UDI5_BLAGS|nr:DUF1640 domain-containing protein [Blastomyces gilchristii SLH14081]OAT05338.1 DUF1640 domain-containing protein [Blastomyces gilchristii SLH14081]